MKNLRELFTEYHNGFQDFGPWFDHHREMHKHHPLDVPEFGAEWLWRWEAVGRLLRSDGYLEWYSDRRRRWKRGVTKSLRLCFEHGWYIWKDQRMPIRIVLLDGTIIREWGPK